MKILLIEDNDTMREGMAQILRKMKFEVTEAKDGAAGLEIFAKDKFALVVTDYKMAGADGLEVLRRVKHLAPETEVMLITAYGSIELAVEAMQEGAADFINKPFSHSEFRVKVEKIVRKIEQDNELRRLSDENVYLREELDGQFNFGEIVGESPKMHEVYRTIQKVAATDSSVLIYGESGTGKELVARAIHKASARNDRSFVRVNCGALAESLLESELFGHERGAFTGAVRRKRGRFELAHGGSIFLDEIGDLPLSTQVKLLRVLQEREFERVGGEETITVDVRVIAATNHDLQRLVREEKFRDDLYYRLHIIPIYMPPLRDRKQDIPALSSHFLHRIAANLGRSGLSLTEEVLSLLQDYDWPGNVRELENVLERAAVLSDDDRIAASDLPLLTAGSVEASMPTSDDDLVLVPTLERIEKQFIEKALHRAHGVKTEAARLLGIKTSALYYKLEKYGLME